MSYTNALLTEIKQKLYKSYPKTYHLLRGIKTGLLARKDLTRFPASKSQDTTPYPIHKDGKPHLHAVWIEASSHCGQKCTFCPEPKRTSPRSFLDYDLISRFIDDLDNFHVDYITLNIYGEALLHPKIKDILRYLARKKVPDRPYFLYTHGMFLTDKNIDILTEFPPSGICVSIQNCDEESYNATRNSKIGTYSQLIQRTENLIRAVVAKRLDCSIKLYYFVNNKNTMYGVDKEILNAFPYSWEEFREPVLFWETRMKEMVKQNGIDADICPVDQRHIKDCFEDANHDEITPYHIVLLHWRSSNGKMQPLIIHPRPIGTYGHRLSLQSSTFGVLPRYFTPHACFFTNQPSLALFANTKLGLCCLDLESTATFGNYTDYRDLTEAIYSDECNRLFRELRAGIQTRESCRICMGYVYNRKDIDEGTFYREMSRIREEEVCLAMKQLTARNESSSE